MPEKAETKGVLADVMVESTPKPPPVKRKLSTIDTKTGRVKEQAAKKPRAKRPTKVAELLEPAEPPPVSGAPTQEDLVLMRRRNRILELREMSGLSFRQISDHMINEQLAVVVKDKPELSYEEQYAIASIGLSQTRIFELAQEGLQDLINNQTLHFEQYQREELNKVDRAETKVLPRLHTAGDADEIEKLTRSVERLWNRRDRLLGLNKPQKVEHSGKDGAPLAIAVTRVILPPGVEDVNEDI